MPATSKRHEEGQAGPAHGQQLNVPQGRPLAPDTYQRHESKRLAETKCEDHLTMNGHNWSICSLGYGQTVEAVTRTKSAIWLRPWPPSDHCFRCAADHGEAEEGLQDVARRGS